MTEVSLTSCVVCTEDLSIFESAYSPCNCGIDICNKCLKIQVNNTDKEDRLVERCYVCDELFNPNHLEVDENKIKKWLQIESNKLLVKKQQDLKNWKDKEILRWIYLERKNELHEIKEKLVEMKEELDEVTNLADDDNLFPDLPTPSLTSRCSKDVIRVGFVARRQSFGVSVKRSKSMPGRRKSMPFKRTSHNDTPPFRKLPLTPQPTSHSKYCFDVDVNELPSLMPSRMNFFYYGSFGDDSNFLLNDSDDDVDLNIQSDTPSSSFIYKKISLKTNNSSENNLIRNDRSHSVGTKKRSSIFGLLKDVVKSKKQIPQHQQQRLSVLVIPHTTQPLSGPRASTPEVKKLVKRNHTRNRSSSLELPPFSHKNVSLYQNSTKIKNCVDNITNENNNILDNKIKEIKSDIECNEINDILQIKKPDKNIKNNDKKICYENENEISEFTNTLSIIRDHIKDNRSTTTSNESSNTFHTSHNNFRESNTCSRFNEMYTMSTDPDNDYSAPDIVLPHISENMSDSNYNINKYTNTNKNKYISTPISTSNSDNCCKCIIV